MTEQNTMTYGFLLEIWNHKRSGQLILRKQWSGSVDKELS